MTVVETIVYKVLWCLPLWSFAPLDVCPYRKRRLPPKTFARQSFASHVKDVCPSRRLPVGRLPLWTFARQSFARHVEDDCPCGRLPVGRLPVTWKTFAPRDVRPPRRLPVSLKTFAPKDVCPSDVCPQDICSSVVCPLRERCSPLRTFALQDVCPSRKRCLRVGHLPLKTFSPPLFNSPVTLITFECH